MKIYLFAFVSALSMVQMSGAVESCPQSLDAAVDQQLTALDNRDLIAYMGTIPPREEQLMILPNGDAWKSRKEIERGHEEWFKDETWTFKRKLQRRDVRDTWGVVTYHVSVDRPNKPGNPFLLSMMFAPEEDGCWYLQYDQNTLLPQE